MRNQKGFSFGELLIVIVIIGVIAAIAIPNLMLAKQTNNENVAINTMRVFARTYGACLKAKTCNLGAPAEKMGYRYGLAVGDGTFDLTAVPLDPGTGYTASGRYSFYLNEHYDNGADSYVGMAYKEGGTAPTADPADRSLTDGEPISKIK